MDATFRNNRSKRDNDHRISRDNATYNGKETTTLARGPYLSYVGLATTLLPMLIMVVMRRYVNGVTVTFIVVLEPIADACFAFFFVHEHLLPQIYLGGMLAIASMVLQACAGSRHLKVFLARGKHVRWSLFRQRIVLPQEDFGAQLRVMPDVPLGSRARILLAQLWERPDGVDLLTLHCLTGIPCGYACRLLLSLQRRGSHSAFFRPQVPTNFPHGAVPEPPGGAPLHRVCTENMACFICKRPAVWKREPLYRIDFGQKTVLEVVLQK